MKGEKANWTVQNKKKNKKKCKFLSLTVHYGGLNLSQGRVFMYDASVHPKVGKMTACGISRNYRIISVV
jgi:hypothetical protein